MIKYIVPLISIFLISCATSKDENFTYVGGKIIHPKGEFVIIYDNKSEVVDSIKLNIDNTFLGKLTDIKTGLYYFKHGPETQYLYLEPQDSLLFRLNTWGFDESLVFSGSNAEENNALIENFLINEKQIKDFYKYNKLSPDDFLKTIDSLKKDKDKYLENFKTRTVDFSDNYLDILKVALYYPLYSKLETYAINNRLKEQPDSINENKFISHRDNIRINGDSLMFFPPYGKYVYNNIYYDVYAKNIKDDSDDFTLSVLETVNNKIESKSLKNKLLKETIIRHFYSKKSCNLNKKAYDLFSKFSSSDSDKAKITKLLADVKHIPKNKHLPSFNLHTPQGSIENINNIIRGNSSVIYFRNKDYSSDKWVASRMNYLIEKNPEINFLVINFNHNNKKYIKNLNIQHQFYLDEKSDAHNFLSSKYPRTILVNKKGIVVNSFCALSSKKIEKQITELH
ncbi:TlpA family protein disulfide reductase [Tenacibaculum sp. ZS6-P6]|uniref:TlpA family protein disulfide reductase n=1 Tax=Tenacibaculum sp. ZS6-P6 TaxID=3447503 RepID=UPI003F943A51